MIASRASYSPDSRVRTSSCSTVLCSRSSSVSASAIESASLSSCGELDEHPEVVEPVLEPVEPVDGVLQLARAGR